MVEFPKKGLFSLFEKHSYWLVRIVIVDSTICIYITDWLIVCSLEGYSWQSFSVGLLTITFLFITPINQYKKDFSYSYRYPMSPPIVRFLTKIVHPNVSRHGDVGIDIIQHNWSLALTISKLLLSVQSLLTDPFTEVFTFHFNFKGQKMPI